VCADGVFYPKFSWQDITVEKSRPVAHGAAIPLHAGCWAARQPEILAFYPQSAFYAIN